MSNLETKLTSIMRSLGWDGSYPDDWEEIDKLGWLLDKINELVEGEVGKVGLHFKMVDGLPETAEEKEYLKTVINNWPFSIETLCKKIDEGSKEHSRSAFIVFSDAASDYSGEIAIKSDMFRELRENIPYSLKELGL